MKRPPRTVRLDQLVVSRGLAPTIETARRLIMAGEIRSGTVALTKAGERVNTELELSSTYAVSFVSRAGYKLEHAINTFALPVRDAICADVGAATGGFTHALLTYGAAKVFAIDVGYGDIAFELRTDPRVVLFERTNARFLDSLPSPVSLVAIDVSFTSALPILSRVVSWLTPEANVVVLVKPQFEASHDEVPRGGVVVDREVHRRVLTEVIMGAIELGLLPHGLVNSPIRGKEGNREFLLWLRLGMPSNLSVEDSINAVVNE